MVKLEPRAILGQTAFAETGKHPCVFWNADRSLVAVTSSFFPMQWHGRQFHDGTVVRYRVALYEAASLRCLGVMDRDRYGINDVAFHPTEPLAAVATGSYDGGFFYEGALYIWDLVSGMAQSLMDESREVTRCAFEGNGSRLAVTLRPPSDEDEAEMGVSFLHAEIEAEDWRTVPEGGIRLDALHTMPLSDEDPRAGDPWNARSALAGRDELASLAAKSGHLYDLRWGAFDIAWLDDERIAVVRNEALEFWTIDGHRVLVAELAGHGVQVLVGGIPSVVTVNAFAGFRFEAIGSTSASTQVSRINLHSCHREALAQIDFPAQLSVAATGHLLARDADFSAARRGIPTRDRVIALDGTVSPALNLGGYDLFNHYLRIDGADHVYFLQL